MNFVKPILNGYAEANQGTYTHFTYLLFRNQYFGYGAIESKMRWGVPWTTNATGLILRDSTKQATCHVKQH